MKTYATKFSGKTLLLEDELLNLRKKTPKIAPPEKKGKKKSKTPQI